MWLVTTDDRCAWATEQAQLTTEWVIVQFGEVQPRLRGLPRGTTLLVATEVLHDAHMAVHTLEDQPGDTGHLLVHQRGGPAWLREHITAPWSWGSTIAGADMLLHDHLAIVRKHHCHVFLGGLDPGQAPLKTLLLMLRLT